VDALPKLPPWTDGWTWAPDVRHVDGRYVMWFSAPDVQDVLGTGAQAKCIGMAVASSPLGPFVPDATPALCGPSGSIDPRTFVASDGQLWLYWKADINAAWGPAQDPDSPANMPTTLWAQRLAANDMTLIGQPQEILTATQPWEHKLIEAPDMVEHDHHYYLFFSTNPSYQDSEGIAVAFCHGPAGPCEEPYNGPLLGSNTLGLGPGEESLFTQDGATWVLYSPTGVGFFRQMAVARIAFGPSGPYVAEFGGRVPGIAPVHRVDARAH
jgi:beta-xylosidase